MRGRRLIDPYVVGLRESLRWDCLWWTWGGCSGWHGWCRLCSGKCTAQPWRCGGWPEMLALMTTGKVGVKLTALTELLQHW